MDKKLKVYVGMSGGVDSSLAAALLVEQGYDVTGVYMKNWSVDLPGMKCPWADDLADAKRVAVRLGIDFKVFDFEKEYKQKVVNYMIDEYKNGHTPNPDVMCNQEVKFKLFLEAALEDGADMIATGHYARVANDETVSILVDSDNSESLERLRAGSNKGHSALFNSGCRCSNNLELPDSLLKSGNDNSSIVFSEHLEPEFSKATEPLINPARNRSEKIGEGLSGFNVYADIEKNSVKKGVSEKGLLLRAVDDNKDQTYFLYRVTGEAMAKTLFPIGEFTKPEVRKMAAERNLTTAVKRDSQGICFIGQVGIKDFLSLYVEQKPGQIIDKKTGKVLGLHEGAIFYTIGQRHGLDVGGGLPYYVVGKNMDKNEVYVTTDINDGSLWKDGIKLIDIHWINDAPVEGKYKIRVRHRAPLTDAELSYIQGGVLLKLDNSERSVAAGQSVVIYDGDVCLGGGIVA